MGLISEAAADLQRGDYAGCALIADAVAGDCPILFATRRFYDFTGYGPEEVIGRNCRFLQGPETDSDTVLRIRAALEARRPLSVVLTNYRRDGTPFRNALFIMPIRDEEGRPNRFAGFQRPIKEGADPSGNAGVA